MVLQSNYARRASNAENVYPSARLSSKRSSNLRSSIQNASKRRRARNTGTPAKNPRYVVEQAKKKSMTKASTAAVDLEVSVPAAPTHVETKDVEMSDMESSGSGSKAEQKTPVSLPRYLIRPDYKEVSRDIISAIDSELADVPLDYIQEGLEITGPAYVHSHLYPITPLSDNSYDLLECSKCSRVCRPHLLATLYPKSFRY